MEAPLAPRRPHTITQHGQTRVDDYFWLRDRDDPAVTRYLEAENAYLDARLAHTAELQKRLFEEMKGRMMETDASPPDFYINRDFAYYYRSEAGKSYQIHCRRKADQPASDEQVVLDENELAVDQPYFRLGAFAPSPDHRWLAFTTDTSGDEENQLRFKNLDDLTMSPEVIEHVSPSAIWANDNATVFYVVNDAAKRPYRVMRHRIGDDPARDALVYEETDQRFFVWIGETADRRYLRIVCYAFGQSEDHIVPLDAPEQPARCVRARKEGVEYGFDHAGSRAYLRTNEDGAKNFKLLVSDAFDGERTAWRELVPHRAEAHLGDVRLFKRHIVRYEREGGVARLRVSDHDGGGVHEIAFPEPAYTLHLMRNNVFDSTVARIWYTSHISPATWADIDLDSGAWTVLKQDIVPSGYDRAQWRSERIWATGRDGARIPISLAYRAGLQLDGDNPVYLTGYGSYGWSSDPAFDFKQISLLERGFVIAIAHVRGGSEMGRDWYESGKLLHKKNTFEDFIACAEHLIAQGYTRPERLAIRGGSAGGLLIGVVINQRPDLFAAAIADVPFVDVINTMSDPSIPLTVPEYGQWGNPEEREAFEYMMSYSPYDNIKATSYPHLLMTAGLNDPRVQYWEPAKFVAKLRAVSTGQNMILLKTNMSAGHAGASGRYDYLREEALRYAFVIDCVGVSP